jgi:rRNA-processing protein FCF1
MATSSGGNKGGEGDQLPAAAVLLDTNILVANFRPGNAFKLLLEGARMGHLQLLVPELVVQEAANKLRERVRDQARVLERAVSELGSLGVVVRRPGSTDEDVAALRYDTELRRNLKQAGAEILPLPAVSHQQMLKRALSRRRPFKKDDAGYRDALLWETILERRLQGGVQLYFCTQNTADFAEAQAGTPVLAADLTDEAERAGFASGQVSLRTDLRRLVAELVDVEAVTADEVERALERLEGEVREAIEGQLYEYEFSRGDLRDSSIDASDRVFLGVSTFELDVDRAEVIDVHIVNPVNLTHASVEESSGLSPDEILVTLYLEMDADLDLEIELEGYDPAANHRWANKTTSATRTIGVRIEGTYLREAEDFTDLRVLNVRIL